MKIDECKTLTTIITAYVKALNDEGVHAFATNEFI